MMNAKDCYKSAKYDEYKKNKHDIKTVLIFFHIMKACYLRLAFPDGGVMVAP
jgi:hypothetical protein